MALFSVVLAAALVAASDGRPKAAGATDGQVTASGEIVNARASGDTAASLTVPASRLPKGGRSVVLSFDLTPETVVPDEAFLVAVSGRAGGTPPENLTTLGLYPPAQPGRRQDFSVPVPDRLIEAARAGGGLTVEIKLIPLAPTGAPGKPPRSVLIVGNPTLSRQ